MHSWELTCPNPPISMRTYRLCCVSFRVLSHPQATGLGCATCGTEVFTFYIKQWDFYRVYVWEINTSIFIPSTRDAGRWFHFGPARETKWSGTHRSPQNLSILTVIGRGASASGRSISTQAYWELPKSWNGSTNGSTKGCKATCRRIGVPASLLTQPNSPSAYHITSCSALLQWRDAALLGRKGLWAWGLKINQPSCCFGNNLWEGFGCKRHRINESTITVWQ